MNVLSILEVCTSWNISAIWSCWWIPDLSHSAYQCSVLLGAIMTLIPASGLEFFSCSPEEYQGVQPQIILCACQLIYLCHTPNRPEAWILPSFMSHTGNVRTGSKCHLMESRSINGKRVSFSMPGNQLVRLNRAFCQVESWLERTGCAKCFLVRGFSVEATPIEIHWLASSSSSL